MRVELPALQTGDTTRDRIVFRAYAAPDGECDSLSCARKLITNSVKENKMGIVENSWKRAARTGHERSETVRSRRQQESPCHNGSIGKLWRGCTKQCRSRFDLSTHANACVVEGDEVFTLRRKECSAPQLFFNTAQVPEDLWGPPLVEEDWVAICLAANEDAVGW